MIGIIAKTGKKQGEFHLKSLKKPIGRPQCEAGYQYNFITVDLGICLTEEYVYAVPRTYLHVFHTTKTKETLVFCVSGNLLFTSFQQNEMAVRS